jgi:hypothetical protein
MIHYIAFSIIDWNSVNLSARTGMIAKQRIRASLGDLYPGQGYVPLAQHKEAVDALLSTTDQVLYELAGSADRPNQ